MGLILFGILFLFGAVGMELRRGALFASVTGVLAFVWMLPIVIQEKRLSGPFYLIIGVLISLVVFLGISMLSYLLGRWMRTGLIRVRKSG